METAGTSSVSLLYFNCAYWSINSDDISYRKEKKKKTHYNKNKPKNTMLKGNTECP